MYIVSESLGLTEVSFSPFDNKEILSRLVQKYGKLPDTNVLNRDSFTGVWIDDKTCIQFKDRGYRQVIYSPRNAENLRWAKAMVLVLDPVIPDFGRSRVGRTKWTSKRSTIKAASVFSRELSLSGGLDAVTGRWGNIYLFDGNVLVAIAAFVHNPIGYAPLVAMLTGILGTPDAYDPRVNVTSTRRALPSWEWPLPLDRTLRLYYYTDTAARRDWNHTYLLVGDANVLATTCLSEVLRAL